MNTAIILAGGIGKRFGKKKPKQFIKINGKEILSYSINTFFNHPKIDEIILVCPEVWIKHVSKQYPMCKIVKGGSNRAESALNGLRNIVSNTQNVLIHDAARPFISSKIISKCILSLKTYDATAPIVSISDSIIKLNKKQISYLDRDLIKIIQTPQCFKKNIITKLLKSNLYNNDEISTLLKLDPKLKIKFVEGNMHNLKITTQNDIILVEKLIFNGP